MSIKITNGDLMNQNFIGGLKQLGAQPLTVKAAWNISRILRLIGKAYEEASGPYQQVIKSHSELDAEGNLKPRMTNAVLDAEGKEIKPAAAIPNTYQVKEGETEALEKDLKEFMEIEITLESYPIKISELVDRNGKDIEISPNTLNAIEKIIEV